MQITSVNIYKTKEGNPLKAFATIVLDNAVAIHSLRVVEGKDGLFVGMPSRKVGETFKDTAHPINAETKALIDEAVLTAYQDVEVEQ